VTVDYSRYIAAKPTTYAGVRFRSRLEARWAAFFDLAGWKWRYEPVDLAGWVPDFWVSFPCRHSECDGNHSLLVEVKPYYLDDHGNPPPEFASHRASRWVNEFDGPEGCPLPYDGVALFGLWPEHTTWAMLHGSGGGQSAVVDWVDDHEALWRQAGNVVQWKGAAA
jgi:hypothetical protein